MINMRLKILYPLVVGTAFLLMGVVFILFLNRTMKQNALQEAAEKADIILHHNLATHLYFSHVLKPEFFRLTESGRDPDYFHPSWMSSTYAVRSIEGSFQNLAHQDYYYKECAINARSPENEADDYEVDFIRSLNADHTLEMKTEIRMYADSPFFVVMHRGEIMEKTCLRCHSKAENAPPGLVDIYGDTRSFNRAVDEVVSAVSIRIPLQSPYEAANKLSLKLSGTLIVLLLGLYIFLFWFTGKLILAPLVIIRDKARKIVSEPMHLGDQIAAPFGHELIEMVDAFNTLSCHLRLNRDTQDDKVRDRTTELAELNRKLISQREFLEVTLENIEDGIVACNEHGILTLFNRASRTFHGIEENSLPPDRWAGHYNLFHPDGETPLLMNEIPLYRTFQGEHIKNIEMVIVSSQGERRVLLASGRQMKDGQDNVLGAVVSLHDITLRKQAEEQIRMANEKLKEVDRLKSLFIASMSHELRTPLNSILGFSGVLVDGMTGPLTDKQHDQLERIHRSARHLLAMINDIIDISKVEAGKIEICPETFLLTELVGEAVNMVKSTEKDRKDILKTDIPVDLKLFTDRKRLLQCLLNLLSNSVKHSPEGMILVTAIDEGDSVEISVTDSGIGIAAENRERIFEPFERLPDSRGMKLLPGTGLGLYLTRKLAVEVLQGQVDFESELGKGSRFWLRIIKKIEPRSYKQGDMQ